MRLHEAESDYCPPKNYKLLFVFVKHTGPGSSVTLGENQIVFRVGDGRNIEDLRNNENILVDERSVSV